jgi:hypothetical protein
MKASYLTPKRSGAGRDAESLEGLAAEVIHERGRRDLLIGGLFLGGGLAVTLLTYEPASREGGTYYVAYGAILFGALQFMRGIFRVRTGRASKFWDVKL